MPRIAGSAGQSVIAELPIQVMAQRGFWDTPAAVVSSSESGGARVCEDRQQGRRYRLLTMCWPPRNGPIRTPSLEVANGAGTQLSGVTAFNRRRTSDVFTPRAPSSTAAGSGGWRVRIWASTCWAVT